MNLVCPECKNSVDLSVCPDIAVGNVIECNMCGITLAVRDISKEGVVSTDIVDEGK
jgi:uncharacterized protein YbaR (Trm112 family)